MPRSIDPKLTENYLMSLVGVIDASVWWQEDHLHAHVTVLDASPIAAKQFKSCCMEDLGLHQTPTSLTIEQRRGFLRVA